MQYMLMLYVNEAGWGKLTKAEQEQGVAAYTAYAHALTKAGVLTGSQRLQPSSAATTVRLASGKPQVLDGPYADSKEQLGGYFAIDVPDLDAAHASAAANAEDSASSAWATSRVRAARKATSLP